MIAGRLCQGQRAPVHCILGSRWNVLAALAQELLSPDVGQTEAGSSEPSKKKGRESLYVSSLAETKSALWAKPANGRRVMNAGDAIIIILERHDRSDSIPNGIWLITPNPKVMLKLRQLSSPIFLNYRRGFKCHSEIESLRAGVSKRFPPRATYRKNIEGCDCHFKMF